MRHMLKGGWNVKLRSKTYIQSIVHSVSHFLHRHSNESNHLNVARSGMKWFHSNTHPVNKTTEMWMTS